MFTEIVPVVGTGYENRTEIITRHCRVGLKAELKREPDNPHDENAIAVYLVVPRTKINRRMKIGYIRRTQAEALAQELDYGPVIDAEVHSFYIPPYEDRVPEVNLLLSHQVVT